MKTPKKPAPGPEFDPHREAIRARWHRVTPFRLGYEVGARGEDLPNPYAPGSLGAGCYHQGLKAGRQWRKRKADEAANKINNRSEA